MNEDPKAKKLCLKDLYHVYELNKLLKGIAAIVARTWAPTSCVLPNKVDANEVDAAKCPKKEAARGRCL